MSRADFPKNRPLPLEDTRSGEPLAESYGGLRAPEGQGFGLTRLLIVFVVLFVLGMGLISVFGSQGWLAYHRLEAEAVELRGEVERLEAHRQNLAEELHALRSDPEYIELLARQRLGLVRPGERVLQLPLQANEAAQ